MKAILQGQRPMDDIPKEGSSYPVKSSGIFSELQKKSNHNMLINWYFGNPINRNGQKEYSNIASYTIDRWLIYQQPGTLVVDSENKAIILKDSEATTRIGQPLEFIMPETVTVTFSLLYKGTVRPYHNMGGTVDTHKAFSSETYDIATHTYEIPAGTNLASTHYPMVGHLIGEGDMYLRAAKLELGNTQTLAHKDENGIWILNDIPNYIEEYLKCSQYDQVSGNRIHFYPSNPNLLDNWYFVGGGSQLGWGQFPINQKEQTEYTGVGYCIDRWRSWESTSECALHDGYITVTRQIAQVIDESLVKSFVGKYLTISVLTESGQLLTATGKVNELKDGIFFSKIGVLDGASWLISLYRSGSSSKPITSFQLNNSKGNTLNLLAAKLELGDHQTLAHKEGDQWVLNDLPDYGTELAKCQRYQVVLRGNSSFVSHGFMISTNRAYTVASLPVPMRAAPTLSFSGLYVVTPNRIANNAVKVASMVNATYMNSNYIAVDMNTETEITRGELVLTQIRESNGFLMADANL